MSSLLESLTSRPELEGNPFVKGPDEALATPEQITLAEGMTERTPTPVKPYPKVPNNPFRSREEIDAAFNSSNRQLAEEEIPEAPGNPFRSGREGMSRPLFDPKPIEDIFRKHADEWEAQEKANASKTEKPKPMGEMEYMGPTGKTIDFAPVSGDFPGGDLVFTGIPSGEEERKTLNLPQADPALVEYRNSISGQADAFATAVYKNLGFGASILPILHILGKKPEPSVQDGQRATRLGAMAGTVIGDIPVMIPGGAAAGVAGGLAGRAIGTGAGYLLGALSTPLVGPGAPLVGAGLATALGAVGTVGGAAIGEWWGSITLPNLIREWTIQAQEKGEAKDGTEALDRFFAAFLAANKHGQVNVATMALGAATKGLMGGGAAVSRVGSVVKGATVLATEAVGMAMFARALDEGGLTPPSLEEIEDGAVFMTTMHAGMASPQVIKSVAAGMKEVYVRYGISIRKQMEMGPRLAQPLIAGVPVDKIPALQTGAIAKEGISTKTKADQWTGKVTLAHDTVSNNLGLAERPIGRNSKPIKFGESFADLIAEERNVGTKTPVESEITGPQTQYLESYPGTASLPDPETGIPAGTNISKPYEVSFSTRLKVPEIKFLNEDELPPGVSPYVPPKLTPQIEQYNRRWYNSYNLWNDNPVVKAQGFFKGTRSGEVYRVIEAIPGDNTHSLGPDDGYHRFFVYDKAGKMVAAVDFEQNNHVSSYKKEIAAYPGYVRVFSDSNRRDGIATAMYNFATKQGIKIAKDGEQFRRPDGSKFRKAYNPEAQNFSQIPESAVAHNPKPPSASSLQTHPALSRQFTSENIKDISSIFKSTKNSDIQIPDKLLETGAPDGMSISRAEVLEHLAEARASWHFERVSLGKEPALSWGEFISQSGKPDAHISQGVLDWIEKQGPGPSTEKVRPSSPTLEVLRSQVETTNRQIELIQSIREERLTTYEEHRQAGRQEEANFARQRIIDIEKLRQKYIKARDDLEAQIEQARIPPSKTPSPEARFTTVTQIRGTPYLPSAENKASYLNGLRREFDSSRLKPTPEVWEEFIGEHNNLSPQMTEWLLRQGPKDTLTLEQNQKLINIFQNIEALKARREELIASFKNAKDAVEAEHFVEQVGDLDDFLNIKKERRDALLKAAENPSDPANFEPIVPGKFLDLSPAGRSEIHSLLFGGGGGGRGGSGGGGSASAGGPQRPSLPPTLKESHARFSAKITTAPRKYGEFGKPWSREWVYGNLSTFYEKMVDALDPMSLAEKKLDILEGRRGPTLAEWLFGVDDINLVGKGDVASRAYKLARLSRGSVNKARHAIEYKTFDYHTLQNNGMGLKDILKRHKKKAEEFRNFLVAARAIELHALGFTSKEVGFDLIDARNIFEGHAKEFGKSAKDLVDYQNRILEYIKDSGLIDQEGFDFIKAKHRAYFPFYRVLAEEALGGGRTFNTQKIIKAFEGIKSEDVMTIDPIESIVRNTHEYIRAAENNRVANLFIDRIEATPGGEAIAVKVKREGNMPKRDDMVRWKDGKMEIYETSPAVARAFKALDGDSTPIGLATRIGSVIAKTLRTAVTLRPDFMLNNIFRDQVTGAMFARYRGVPVLNAVYGMRELMKGGEQYQAWLKSGGAASVFEVIDRDYISRDIWNVSHETGLLDRAWNVVTSPFEAAMQSAKLSQEMGNHPFITAMEAFAAMHGANDFVAAAKNVGRTIEDIGSAFENATRLGEFMRVAGKNPTFVKMMEGGYAGREVTVDFQRRGSATKAFNLITAFWNVGVQGVDRTVRAFKDRPLETSMRTTLGITIPSIMLWYANKDDKEIQDTPPFLKFLSWQVKTDWGPLKLPKPFELGLMGTVPAMVMDLYFGQNPYALEEELREGPLGELLGLHNGNPHAFKGGLHGIFLSGIPNFLVTGGAGPLAHYSNVNNLTGNQVVPSYLLSALPADQYTPYTTETAKMIGAALEKSPFAGIGTEQVKITSPIIVEEYIRSLLGTTGINMLQLLDQHMISQGIIPDPVKPLKYVTDWVFVKSFFIKYPSMNSAAMQDFFDEYTENEKWARSMKLAEEREDDKRIAELEAIAEKQPWITVDLEPFKEFISEGNAAIQKIHQDPGIEPAEKRQLIDGLMMDMIGSARTGMQVMEEEKKRFKQEQEGNAP